MHHSKRKLIEDIPDVSPAAPDRLSRSITELSDAVTEFAKNYQEFASKNRQYLLIDDDVGQVLQPTDTKTNFRSAAQLFELRIQDVMRTVEKKNQFKAGKWTTKLGSFLRKIYPVCRLSVRCLLNVAEVPIYSYNR